MIQFSTRMSADPSIRNARKEEVVHIEEMAS
jgi:hypothetical protein